MFGLFKKKPSDAAIERLSITVTLNSRLQPMHRGDLYEDPLDDLLAEDSIGEITGGGTQLSESGEVEFCDMEVSISATEADAIAFLKVSLENLGTPKGSKIIVHSTGNETAIGTLEGLALYLNGTDLDDEVYSNNDPNELYSDLDRLTAGVGRVYSYWQGPKETALYLYGRSYTEMNSRIAELIEANPLCQKCRVEQIA